MKMAKSVEEYLSENPWRSSLEKLRDILNETELTEELKWGTPHYTLNKKIVVGIAGFKSYAGLWFHQGVFVSDPAKVLINAQEGTTRGLRQWRFNSTDEIDPELVKSYVEEAIANQKAGKEIKVQAKALVIPDILKEALASDAALSEAFDALTPGKQKEYANYIGEAKQEATQQKRKEKCIPMILEGKGLNDKYRK